MFAQCRDTTGFFLFVLVALLLPADSQSAEDDDPAPTAERGAASWGTPPCEGIAMGNFEACPDALVGAQTCCGVGVCSSTGQLECSGGELQNSCVPGEPESTSDASCDGVDQNCSGEADEDFSSDSTTCGTGACAATGQTVCENGEISDTCTPGEPKGETCNGVDDDCNGLVDEGLGGDTTTCGTGACAATGQTVCENGEISDTCTPGEPGDEICNGVDDDCNGLVDDGLGGETTTCGVGECAATGQTVCEDGTMSDTCTPGQPEPEICGDGKDNDCDGVADEGCPV